MEEPWSNDQAEGQISRLKTLKRQIYGRAKLDLLRARMIAASRTRTAPRVSPSLWSTADAHANYCAAVVSLPASSDEVVTTPGVSP